MLRRRISAFSAHVAATQRRGYLTVVVRSGAQKAECRLSVAWESVASSSSKIIQVLPSRRGKADASRVTVNSIGAGGVLASAELMPAAMFQAKQARGGGRQSIMLDLMIWPNQSRACITIMKRSEKFGWAWQSSWSFNMEQIRNISNSQDDGALVKVLSSPKEPHLQYKGYIGKGLDAEFELTMKSHFKVQGTLGRGGQGDVFKCISKEGAHGCAIKRYNSRKPVAEEPREPRAMKMISHPNVKKFYFAWKEDESGLDFKKSSSIYLAQELSKGTVDDYLDAKIERSIEEKVRIFKETVIGVMHLHQEGIVHRDVKPSNIFLHHQNRANLGDFGSSAFTGSPSCKGGKKFLGTYYYASPEMLALHGHNEKTDVFSLGVVYFELFGGRATTFNRCRRLEKLRELFQKSELGQGPPSSMAEVQPFKRMVWRCSPVGSDAAYVPRASAQMSRDIAQARRMSDMKFLSF